jgi:hypothetical protein
MYSLIASKLAQPGTFTDSLTEILRNGAQALLGYAVEAEVADFSPSIPVSSPRTAIGASCVIATCLSARS